MLFLSKTSMTSSHVLWQPICSQNKNINKQFFFFYYYYYFLKKKQKTAFTFMSPPTVFFFFFFLNFNDKGIQGFTSTKF